jgi:UDP-3-O-[3-hydroxymyristoyl] glucosamine N-acyltransferase
LQNVDGVSDTGRVYVFSLDPDSDSDGIPNNRDNCPTVYNPGQEQTGNNVGTGFGDACIDPSVTIPDSADVASDATIGAGSSINKEVTISSGADIGESVILNKNSSVGENTTVGDNTTVNKNAVIGNDVVIGENVTIGKDVTIADGVTIGNNVTIKKCAHVVADVPDNTVIPKGTCTS